MAAGRRCWWITTSFFDLMDELEIRRAFAESEVSIREGRGIPNEVVMQELRERYGL